MSVRPTKLLVLAGSIVITACSPSHHTNTVVEHQKRTGQLTITPEYWCDFVPTRAFSEITGLTGVYDQRDGWLSHNGSCLVYDNSRDPSLGLSWAMNGPEVVERQEKAFAQAGIASLPPDLGHGFSVDTPDPMEGRPYYVIATFKCASASPWIRINLSRILPGRNSTQDLADLMRTTQRRFRALHKCT